MCWGRSDGAHCVTPIFSISMSLQIPSLGVLLFQYYYLVAIDKLVYLKHRILLVLFTSTSAFISSEVLHFGGYFLILVPVYKDHPFELVLGKKGPFKILLLQQLLP